MAAGLRLMEAKLPAFVEDFTEFVNARVTVEQLVPALRIDCDASIAELTPLAVERLDRLGPFGRGNPSPSLRLTGLSCARAPEAMGAHGRHMSMVVRQESRMMRLVGWSWGEHRTRIPAGAALEAVIRPKINRWRGKESVEGEICDVRIVSGGMG